MSDLAPHWFWPVLCENNLVWAGQVEFYPLLGGADVICVMVGGDFIPSRLDLSSAE
jgi:hypothetical protein